MGKATYIGVDGKARRLKNIYIGVNGVARRVKSCYIGVDGVARQFFSSAKLDTLPVGAQFTYAGLIESTGEIITAGGYAGSSIGSIPNVTRFSSSGDAFALEPIYPDNSSIQGLQFDNAIQMDSNTVVFVAGRSTVSGEITRYPSTAVMKYTSGGSGLVSIPSGRSLASYDCGAGRVGTTNKILIAGGAHISGNRNTVALVDISSGGAEVEELLYSTSKPCCVPVGDDEALVFGGQASGSVSFPTTIYRYNSSGSQTVLSTVLTQASSSYKGLPFQDGTAFVTNGFRSFSIDRTGKQTAFADLESSRYGFSLVVLPDGRVAVVGGSSTSSGSPNISKVEIYSSNGTKEVITPSTPIYRRDFGCSIFNGEYIALIGGRSNTTTYSAETGLITF